MLTPADILVARRRIAGIAHPTPLEHSRPLSAHTGAEVYLKLECAQVTGSFKVRGAASALRVGEGRWTLNEHHLVIEGSAAVVVAALLNGLIAGLSNRKVVALLCGRNVATETLLSVVNTP